jgi:3-(3-hydroxy-phenyl)propionate hydroxylase
VNTVASDTMVVDGMQITRIALSSQGGDPISTRLLGHAGSAVYLVRPDQHVVARWKSFDPAALIAAIRIATATERGPS